MDREKVKERDHYLCITCGAPGESIHHVIKRERAKVCRMVNSEYNLVVKCTKCHEKSHNDKARYKDLQYLISKYGVQIYDSAPIDDWRMLLRRKDEFGE